MAHLFEYFDYQKYLRDFYEEEKQADPYMTLRYWSECMGLDHGFLLKVMQGKHHIAKRSIAEMCRYFKFTEAESRYFEALVLYNKAKSAADIKIYFEKLTAIRIRDPRLKPLEEYQYAFYQKWYHSAIHALLSIYEFKDGRYKNLALHLSPAITTEQAKESIELLTKLGMIKRGDDGIFRPTDLYVTSGERWHPAAVRTFQKEAISLSAQALDTHPKETRDISTVTVALSQDDLPEISERISKLRKSILMLNSGKERDVVYQINVQVIPVTVPLGGKK